MPRQSMPQTKETINAILGFSQSLGTGKFFELSSIVKRKKKIARVW